MVLDKAALAQEGLRHLKVLLAFDTTNPPGNEMPAIRYLEGVLRAEGFTPVVIETAAQRGNLVVRLAGDGSEKPLLLLSHLDVVAADPSGWEVPPFAAAERGGYLYGRGALDMKHMTAMSLMALLHCKRRGCKLKRDLILAAVADEEAGGKAGAGYLVEHHPDLLRAEYALGEVGGFRVRIKGHDAFLVQVAERGCAWCKVRFRGEPGHGSVPDPDSAIHRLARALTRLRRKGLPYHLTDPVRRFVEEVSLDQGWAVRRVLKGLLSRSLSRAALRLVDREQARVFYAQLHNTATPTVLRAGDKENVSPGVAEVVLDGRVLPGGDWASFEQELRAVLGKDAEIEQVQWMEPLVYPHDTPLFDLLRRVVSDHEPECRVIPYLSTAFTDAKHLHKLGVITYGFTPMNNDPSEKIARLIHGHNERIGLDAFLWGVEVLAETVERFCSAPSAHAAVDQLLGDLLPNPPPPGPGTDAVVPPAGGGAPGPGTPPGPAG